MGRYSSGESAQELPLWFESCTAMYLLSTPLCPKLCFNMGIRTAMGCDGLRADWSCNERFRLNKAAAKKAYATRSVTLVIGPMGICAKEYSS
jgi:hypothetical protein